MARRRDRQIDGRIDKQIEEQTQRKINVWIEDKHTDRQRNRFMDGLC
jgi:hypothetical protein